MSKKKEAVLTAIKIRCPKLDKLITVPAKNVSWTGYEDDCDMCGSHGAVRMTVTCKCGKYHDIDVSEW